MYNYTVLIRIYRVAAAGDMRTNGGSPMGHVNASADQAKMMALARAHLMGGSLGPTAATATFAVPNAPAPNASATGAGTSRLLAPGTRPSIGSGLPTRPTPPSSLLALGPGSLASGRSGTGNGIFAGGASGLMQPRMMQQTALSNGTRPLTAQNGALAAHSAGVSALAQYQKPAAPASVAHYAPAAAPTDGTHVAWDDECY